ncbi:MAG: hypothetical protein OEQ47_19305, partial [Acidimicrobiia bacterium]|nr:hypothetical protein [Acidimicrobiia bacterium]
VGPAFLLGSDIEGAEAGFVGTVNAGWVVDPEFTGEGAIKFEHATEILTLFDPGDPRRSIAIVVDGEVVSAPQVSEQLARGEALDADNVYITAGGGADQQAKAEDLATILRYGALPTTFERERLESLPPQCMGPKARIVNPDEVEADFTQQDDIRWTDRVVVLIGEMAHGALTITD